MSLSVLKDFSLPAVVAGFVTVLVGFTSSAVVVFQAAQGLGATPAEIGSWMWALGWGMGITCIGLSLRYRVPVVTAWSTPGAAMLITAAAGARLDEAIGAFTVSAALMALAGFSGAFERVISRIPVALASAMLAGILLRFGIDLFTAMQQQFAMGFAMFAVYLAMRRLQPRYAVVATLAVGIAVAGHEGLLKVEGLHLALAMPTWTTPAFSLQTLVSIAIPLFVVTMASQNIPGLSVLRASGYSAPVSPVIGWIGTVNLVLAPFGAFALNLAAITAAICMGREAHEDPAKRYTASISAGAIYCVVGVFGATVAAVFAAFPRELVLVIAGLALLGTIGSGLAGAVADERHREPALVTFLVTASGVSYVGVGSAFWGLVAGALAMDVLRGRLR